MANSPVLFFFFLCIFFSSILTGCGSSNISTETNTQQGSETYRDTTNSNYNPPAKKVKITGHVFDGPVEGINCTIHHLKADGTLGNIIGEATTDANGYFEKEVEESALKNSDNSDIDSGSLIFLCSGGVVHGIYGDTPWPNNSASSLSRAKVSSKEDVNVNVNLSGNFSSIFLIKNEGSVHAEINLSTTMATQKALTDIKTYNKIPAKAIEDANNSVSLLLGISDITTARPFDVTQQGSASGRSQDDILLSVLTLGFEKVSKNYGVNPVLLNFAIVQDANDGKFDGMNGDTAIKLLKLDDTTMNLPPEAMATDLAKGIKELQTNNNITLYIGIDLTPFLDKFGKSNGGITGTEPLPVIPTEGLLRPSAELFRETIFDTLSSYGGENIKILATEYGILTNNDEIVLETEYPVRSITGCEGVFVAVGDHGGIYTSPTGKPPWTKRDSGTTEDILKVECSISLEKMLIVAVGKNGTALTSPDGEIWNENALLSSESLPTPPFVLKKPQITSNDLYGISINNGTIIITGAYGTIITSSDYGATWALRTSGFATDLRDITYGNNMFVAVGDGKEIVTSTDDGDTWISSGLTNYYSLYGVTFGRSSFVAVGFNGVIITSPDGITWTQRISGTKIQLNAVNFNETTNTFTAVGMGGLTLTSPDGITWTPETTGNLNSLQSIAYNGDFFVSVGMNGTIMTSTDGTDWTEKTSGTTDSLNGVAFGNNTLVSVGGLNYPAKGTILTSSDSGNTWVNITAGTNVLEDIAFGNNTFVTGGYGGAIFTSIDKGVSWNPQTTGIADRITGISFGNNIFVAVTESGKCLTSADGVNWTTGTIEGAPMYGITFGNGVFVATGWDGVILTSADGMTWISRPSGTTDLMTGVGFGNNTFMAVGHVFLGSGYTTVLTSTDNGATWTPRVAETANWLNRLVFGGGRFVAVGNWGTILTSGGTH